MQCECGWIRPYLHRNRDNNFRFFLRGIYIYVTRKTGREDGTQLNITIFKPARLSMCWQDHYHPDHCVTHLGWVKSIHNFTALIVLLFIVITYYFDTNLIPTEWELFWPWSWRFRDHLCIHHDLQCHFSINYVGLMYPLFLIGNLYLSGVLCQSLSSYEWTPKWQVDYIEIGLWYVQNVF